MLIYLYTSSKGDGAMKRAQWILVNGVPKRVINVERNLRIDKLTKSYENTLSNNKGVGV